MRVARKCAAALLATATGVAWPRLLRRSRNPYGRGHDCQATMRACAAALLAATVVLSAAGSALADVRLPAIFGDHMVLQRDVPIAVWGWADPREKVTVTLHAMGESKDGKPVPVILGGMSGSGPGDRISAQAVAGDKGAWSVNLNALKSLNGMTGLRLKVEGKNTVEFTDVALGDVWVASGQSNMYWPVKNSANPKAEIAAADHPTIRSFNVWKDAAAEPRDDVYGEWTVCSPKTAGEFSAAAYYFARHLNTRLGVPIGIIHSSWAASSAHPWTSREGLAADPEVKAFAENVMERTADSLRTFREEWEPKWAEWEKAAAAARAEGKPEPRRPAVTFRDNVRAVPSALYNGMIAPLARYRVKGVIWYQGENDAHRGMFYHKIFAALIRDWRTQWKQPDMPFLFVQLAGFKARQPEPGDSQWAELREAQAATLSVPHTAMACTIDIGEAENIHPKNKQDVGLRLALGSLHVAYGKDLVYSGPVFKEVKLAGNKATLTFDHVGGGLVARGGGPLKGFAVAGPDGKFAWADAWIEGDAVIVTGADVKEIAAVRYAWADNPECNLHNAEGLPAVPFRTDGR